MNVAKYIVTLVLPFLLLSCYNKKPNVKTGLEGKPMPTFDLLLIDSTSHLNSKDIPKGKPAILFSFEPWCPYCKAQTKSILSHIESLKDIDFYFVTNSAYSKFKEFYNRFELGKYKNIVAGIDYTYDFARYYKIATVPYMAIYGKDKELKQILLGKNYISTIKEAALN